jgi:thiosulfate/3-mercaptopyruvate sulfurtransferase
VDRLFDAATSATRRRGRVTVAVPPVVDVAWIADHRDEVVVCDVRWYLDGRSGPDAYEAGHVPGAVFVDLDRVLAGPPGGTAGRHPLPDPERFAAEMGRLGVGDDTIVVAYDDAGGMVAARLVWMLRVTGGRAALLDGGLAAVLDGGLAAVPGPLETGPVEPRPVDRRPVPWPAGAVVDADAVARHAAAGGVVIDARAPERYRGDTEPVDARAGHIPGAVNLPYTGNLEGGRFLAPAELRARYEAVGAGRDAVVYCGSGVSACHDVLAMEHAGLGRPRLFVGSWSAWSADPDRPVATGYRP